MKSLLNKDRFWRENRIEEDLVDQVRKKLNCSRVFAELVADRYGESHERASLSLESLRGSPEDVFHSPEDLPDMSEAVERIVKALEEEQKVFIQGDFDVDGLSSSALLYRGLRNLESLPGPGELKVEVGNRDSGHGISREVSSRLIDEEFDLLITTDCGVKGVAEITHLRNFGVDVIVTDHHEPSDSLPPALAVVDPKRDDSDYPNSYLAGAGVAYKLVQGLLNEIGDKRNESGTLVQLAALGTISDLVPLVVDGEDENRWLVRAGLEELNQNPLTGVSAILGETGRKDSEIGPDTVSYQIAPKLNSANRVGDPQVSFLLLATENREKADHLAKTLIDYNRDRSRIQNKLTRQAVNKLQEIGFDPEEEGIVFVAGEDWNPGILGLISSQLSSKYNLPAVTVSKSRPKSRGSARGTGGLSIYEGLKECSRHLSKFGGHEMAGGFSVDSFRLEPLRECLKSWASSKLEEYDKTEEKSVDSRLDSTQVSLDLFRELQTLAPFGKGNPKPKFWMDGLEVVSARRVGSSKNHLKMKLGDGEEIMDSIGFGMGEELALIKDQDKVRPVFTLDLNDWGGRESVQLKLEDFLSQG